EGEGEGEVEAAITFDPEYTNASGVTFIPCEGAVTVTLPTPVATDYVVYLAVKWWDGGEEEYEYDCWAALEPNADRTIWTLAEYNPSTPDDCCVDIDECEPLCVVAMVKHPCCPGEEVALRVVLVDCTPPELDLFVKFTDCYDPCAEDDPCVEEFEGVSMEWTSRTTDECETTDCCEDDCSGEGDWSLVIDPDPCAAPCDTIPGTGCPVEGVLECACFAYADTGEVCYYVDFSFEDNVGNARESTWKICLDTDEVVEFEKGWRNDDGDYQAGSDKYPDAEGWYTVYGDCQ
ncbi:MAG: hypothetical protein KAX28_06065, partial [Candidatus Marinimicrobia bacterium]|nr:hypothetical protein [Candidatus Neomarinimicrobiota bacterium]